MPYNDQTFLHDDTAVSLEDDLRADYLAIRSAIVELATGTSVVRLTVNGKTTEFGQTDIATLRVLRDELAEELRVLTGRNAEYKCHKAMTSKGF